MDATFGKLRWVGVTVLALSLALGNAAAYGLSVVDDGESFEEVTGQVVETLVEDRQQDAASVGIDDSRFESDSTGNDQGSLSEQEDDGGHESAEGESSAVFSPVDDSGMEELTTANDGSSDIEDKDLSVGLSVMSGSATAALDNDELYQLRAVNFPEYYGYRDGQDWGSTTASPIDPSAKGSYGYAYSFARRVHRVLRPESGVLYAWAVSRLATGDIIKTSSSHWLIVISRNGTELYTAEGDHNGIVRAGRGYYRVSGQQIVDITTGDALSVAESYHYEPSESIFNDFKPGSIALADVTMRTLDGDEVTLHGTYGGKKRVYISGEMGCGWSTYVFAEASKIAALPEYKDIIFVLMSDPNYTHSPGEETYLPAYGDARTQNLIPCNERYGTVSYFDVRATSCKGLQRYDIFAQPWAILIDENGCVADEMVCTTETQNVFQDSWYALEYPKYKPIGSIEQAINDAWGIKRSVSRASVAPVDTVVYTGRAHTPLLSVSMDGNTLDEETDYSVVYSNNTDVGTASAIITGTGSYTGSRRVTFRITKASNPIEAKAKKAIVSVVYKPSAKNVTAANVSVKEAKGSVSYSNVSIDVAVRKFAVDNATGTITVPKATKAGTYDVRVKATAAGNTNYEAGSKIVSYKIVITKAAQPMKIKAVKRTAKAAKVKKKAVTVAAPLKFTKRAQGKVSYAKVAKGSAKCLTVNKKNGKVTVKRGTKKGTYKVKIKVTAKGNANYKAGSKTVNCKVVVK